MTLTQRTLYPIPVTVNALLASTETDLIVHNAVFSVIHAIQLTVRPAFLTQTFHSPIPVTASVMMAILN
jgi:hypothetical protein